MKIQMTKSDTLRAIKQCESVVRNKSPIPILSCMVLEAGENTIRMVATDIVHELVIVLPARVDAPGRVAIPISRISEIIDTIPSDGELTISCTAGRATITSGKKRFMVGLLDPEDFPVMPLSTEGSKVTVLYDDLCTILSAVDFAAPRDDARHYLNGIYLSTSHGVMRAVATNGHILGIAECQCSVNDTERSVIIPKQIVRTILRLATPSPTEVSVVFGERDLAMTMGDDRISLRGIEGRFPDYDRVVPRNSSEIARVDRSDIFGAIEAASICHSGNFGAVVLSFTQGQVAIRGKDINGDEADVDLPIAYDGRDLELALCSKYVLGVLSSLRCARVRISMVDAVSAVLIEDEESDAIKYVIMPTKL